MTDVIEADLLPLCQHQGCRITARPGQPLCDQHAVEQRQLAARRKLADAADMAADVLIDLAANAVNEDTRRRASEGILDRVGLRPGVDVQVTAREARVDPAEILRERLALLRRRTLHAGEDALPPAEPDARPALPAIK